MLLMPRMIPVREIERTIGLPEDYLIRLCEMGRFPAQKVDGTWVVSEADMEAARKAPFPILPPTDDDPF